MTYTKQPPRYPGWFIICKTSDGDIEFTIRAVTESDQVRVGIEVPDTVKVLRGELVDISEQ